MKFISFLFCILSGTVATGDTFSVSYQFAKNSGDFEKLQERLKATEFLTVEDFLKTWKQDRPEFFKTYVAAYRSRSLQQSSYTYPRIVMFNRNADLVMSFNGHPRHRGYQNVEMIRFNHDKNNFEFYELTFREGAKAEISAANPVKCLECHQGPARQGVDPRPNWEPYNAWLGFYGSIDDDTQDRKSGFLRDKAYNPETDSLLAKEFDEEPQKFLDFIYEVIPSHPRYKHLDMVVNDYNSSEPTINGELTNRLATLNFRRVARLMKAETAVYDQVKWTIYGFAVCGQNFWVNPEVFDWLKSVTPRQERLQRENIASYSSTHVGCKNFGFDECASYVPPKPAVEYPRLEATGAINLMFEPFGVNTGDWSMDFKTNARFAAFERFGVANDPRPPFAAAVKRVFGEDPDFKDVNCEQVKVKSLELFGSLEKTKAFYNKMQATQKPVSPEKPLIQRCVSCHVTDNEFNNAPAIPFDDPVRLKTKLKEEGYKRGTLMEEILFRTGPHSGLTDQMPPQGIPSEHQREELIKYLKSL